MSKEPKGSAIVLVLVVPLVLENADTGWDVEDENENDDEDETSVHGKTFDAISGAHWDLEPN